MPRAFESFSPVLFLAIITQNVTWEKYIDGEDDRGAEHEVGEH